MTLTYWPIYMYLITAIVGVQAEVANPLKLVNWTLTVMSCVNNTSVYQHVLQHLLRFLHVPQNNNTVTTSLIPRLGVTTLLIWYFGLLDWEQRGGHLEQPLDPRTQTYNIMIVCHFQHSKQAACLQFVIEPNSALCRVRHPVNIGFGLVAGVMWMIVTM